MEFEQLKLKNQICFPVYAASRLIIREYQPHLDRLGITYPQYLALMVLWEEDGLTVNEIGRRLILNTNTLTPLLKRMEAQGLIQRQRAAQDERRVLVSLTPAGRQMQTEAAAIPEQLATRLLSGELRTEDLRLLKEKLDLLVERLAAGGAPDES